MEVLALDNESREHWWQVWRKKKGLPDKQMTYLAFIAGWNAGSMNERGARKL